MSNSRSGSTAPKEAVSTVAEGLMAARRSTRPLSLAVDQIGLGQDQAVRNRHLLYRFGLARERGEAVDGIDGRHHAGEREALRDAGIAHQRVQDGGGIGKPAGLDDDALERRHACPHRAGQASPPASAPDRRGWCSTGTPSAASTKLSSLVSIRSWSSPTSPNSLMITAVRENSGLLSRRASSVVLPLPRKPVSTETGIMAAAAAGARCAGGSGGSRDRRRRGRRAAGRRWR